LRKPLPVFGVPQGLIGWLQPGMVGIADSLQPLPIGPAFSLFGHDLCRKGRRRDDGAGARIAP
jgi:hypothetical protein